MLDTKTVTFFIFGEGGGEREIPNIVNHDIAEVSQKEDKTRLPIIYFIFSRSRRKGL